MMDAFAAEVKSQADTSTRWIVAPKIINHDGKPHDNITVTVRDGIKPTIGDTVMVELIKNNLDFTNINEFYQASRTNGVIIGIIMTSGNNYYLVGNYNFKGDTVNDGKLNVTGKSVFGSDMELNGNSVGIARLNDSINSNASNDTIFWAWLAAAATVLAGLGVVAPTPTSLTGKITSASGTVKTS